jgi:diguanylate cyclase (GGDEF)-like protein/PAS domain S-box-containing protein
MDINTIKQRAKAFDYLFDAVVVTDLNGIIIDWNKGSEDLYGYTKEEAIGQPVNILHVPEDSETITAEVISTVTTSGKWTGEIRMLRKDGTIGWVESMCVPLFDSENQMVGALGINRDITERINEAERLKRLAHYDQLTELPNRYMLFDRFDHLVAQSRRNGNMFALLFVDLDNFKSINDTYGHLFGDKVLLEVASRLKASVRTSDTIARIGGDEFVLLLESIADKNAALKVVESLHKDLCRSILIDDNEMIIECSIGISIYPDDGNTTDQLLTVADNNMYKHKRIKSAGSNKNITQ